MTSHSIRILVADDHQVFRREVAKLLGEYPGIEIAGEASDGSSAVELARKLHPDVILMDVIMPGLNGIEATEIIRRELPQVQVIGLSMHNEIEIANAMKQAGAFGYLSKTESPDQVVESIRCCVTEHRTS